MKKLNELQLLASVFLLAGSGISLLNLFVEISSAKYSWLLLLVSIILYGILLIKRFKLKKIKKDADNK